MGLTCSDLQQECDRDKKCYVDQNEMKFSSRSNVKLSGASGPSATWFSSRSTAASSCSLQTNQGSQGQRLSPQSVSWADGLCRQRGASLGRVQLTPKASSFAHGAIATPYVPAR
ncbi:unnamed protein product [Effrenium voratum]|uniref:Uncharacterized protein n=1 Tax=Effrenium voratum TaxID=2562239 RepID=A0AA36I5Q2_9DINO|nr:unnamed protein product [Effrenium voratum]CAJ1381202.1 unnamed protein product [Effrenium voratum]CAJ1433995.1 unnamed protein product [Effrenium voratum]|mmetsp:Transcript_100191/g.238929  ORF Transcript_100191/g.238929 Transcript_100191/m.238929 type:complete len:114 (-) Transcript_100191:90-431(-)